MGVIKAVFAVAAVEMRGSVNFIEAADFLGSRARVFLHIHSIDNDIIFAIVVVVHGDVNCHRRSRRNACVYGILSRGRRGRGVGPSRR